MNSTLQTAGAATFIAEYAPTKRRGVLGSFLEFGTLWGYILGSGLVLVVNLLLGEGRMHAWGWRIPFLVALPLGLVGLWGARHGQFPPRRVGR